MHLFYIIGIILNIIGAFLLFLLGKPLGYISPIDGEEALKSIHNFSNQKKKWKTGFIFIFIGFIFQFISYIFFIVY